MSLQATELLYLQPAEVIERIGPLFTKDETKTGLLASVSLGQFILESGYGKTLLAQNANNCFGMKTYLSGNTWKGSTWDGVSFYSMDTDEYTENGSHYIETAKFRKYPCIEDSIEDHSNYLLNAMNGNRLRYDGLYGEKDYKKAITIIKSGGYATDPMYVSKVCELIERWNLTRFNSNEEIPEEEEKKPIFWYRVRKSWDNPSSQLAAYLDLNLAKEFVKNNPGYYVLDMDGKVLYPITTKKNKNKKK